MKTNCIPGSWRNQSQTAPRAAYQAHSNSFSTTATKTQNQNQPMKTSSLQLIRSVCVAAVLGLITSASIAQPAPDAAKHPMKVKPVKAHLTILPGGDPGTPPYSQRPVALNDRGTVVGNSRQADILGGPPEAPAFWSGKGLSLSILPLPAGAPTGGFQRNSANGAETAAHLRENGRIVIMFCALDGPPKIVRLHGHGTVITPGDDRFTELAALFPANPGTRAFVHLAVQRISDSCGHAVPLYEFRGPRDTLDQWATHQGPEKLAAYRDAQNQTSIDGLPAFSRHTAQET
jgi:Pyridoxamine 5'-phosphate oxidase